jgi:hypothetical protein
MIRIIGGSSCVGPKPEGQRSVQNLHPFVDYQCCSAISHLQHEVEFPNCRITNMAPFPNRGQRLWCNAL